MSESILITGGTGFAGSHLVEELVTAGQIPHVTTFNAQPNIVNELLPADHVHAVNLSDATALGGLLDSVKPTHIYHLAALAASGSSFQMTETILEKNLKLQLILLEQLKEKLPTSRCLIIGSGLEYDPFSLGHDHEPLTELHPLGPINPYAVSKVLQDLLALSYHYSYQLPILRVRPFNHTGERQSPDFAIPAFAKQIVAIERGQQSEIKVGDLRAVRDISDVKDIVKAYVLVTNQARPGQVYNLGSGQGYTMQSILDQLCELSTAKVTVTVDQSRFRPNDAPYLVADISKINQLGWTPQIPIRDTLERVLNYWRKSQS